MPSDRTQVRRKCNKAYCIKALAYCVLLDLLAEVRR